MFTSISTKIALAANGAIQDIISMFAYASGQPYYWFIMIMFFIIHGEVAVPCFFIGLGIFAFIRFVNYLRQY